MVEYSDLDVIIKQLKKAAIDAYMKDRLFNLNGGEYMQRTAQPLATVRIEAPNADGEGGGRLLEGKPYDEDQVENFDAIRSKIDSIVSRWKGLPEPSGLSANRVVCGDVVLELSAMSDRGQIGGTGDAARHLQNAVVNSASLSGETMISFRENLLGNIGPTMDALAVAYHFVGETLEREEKAVEYTRKAVANAVDGARDTFSKIANQGFDKGTLEFAVNIIKMAVKGVIILAPLEGVLAKLIEEIGFKIIEEAISGVGDDKDRHPGNFDTAMRDFEALMNRINEELTAVEEDVSESILLSQGVIAKRINHFRIELKALHTKDVDNKNLENDIKEVNISREEAYHIARTNLPELANCLRASLNKASGLNMPSRRDHPVGIRVEGPQLEFLNFKNRLDSLLGELAEDVELGAYNLKVALEAFDAVDNEERDKFQERENSLEESASTVEKAQNRQKPVSYDP